jgi:hypothetical protein
VARRSFLRKMGIAAASLAPVTGLLLNEGKALAKEFGRGLTEGDVAILRFLAAAEILETDLRQQYNEFGGVQDSEVSGGSRNAAYTAALVNLDADIPQYVHDNTDDENSHQLFLNAFLQSVGPQPVNFDRFRTLPSSMFHTRLPRREYPETGEPTTGGAKSSLAVSQGLTTAGLTKREAGLVRWAVLN